MSDRDLLLAWLNDAHAMEKSAIEMFERHVQDADGHPDVQEMFREFRTMSERKASRLQASIEGRGASLSKVKTAGAMLAGMVEGMMNRPFRDTLVKDFLVQAAGTHFAVASYRALVQAAERAGERETAAMCNEFVEEGLAAARRLEDAQRRVVDATLGGHTRAA